MFAHIKEILGYGGFFIALALQLSGMVSIPLSIIFFIIGIGCLFFAFWQSLKNIQIGKSANSLKINVSPRLTRIAKIIFISMISLIILGGSFYFKHISKKNETINNKNQIIKDQNTLIENQKKAIEKHMSSNWENITKIPIINKTFFNEKVILDGYSYSNCKFRNVTLVYEGKAPFDLVYNKFEGDLFIKSTTPQISALILLLKEVRMLGVNVKFIK